MLLLVIAHLESCDDAIAAHQCRHDNLIELTIGQVEHLQRTRLVANSIAIEKSRKLD